MGYSSQDREEKKQTTMTPTPTRSTHRTNKSPRARRQRVKTSTAGQASWAASPADDGVEQPEILPAQRSVRSSVSAVLTQPRKQPRSARTKTPECTLRPEGYQSAHQRFTVVLRQRPAYPSSPPICENSLSPRLLAAHAHRDDQSRYATGLIQSERAEHPTGSSAAFPMHSCSRRRQIAPGRETESPPYDSRARLNPRGTSLAANPSKPVRRRRIARNHSPYAPRASPWHHPRPALPPAQSTTAPETRGAIPMAPAHRQPPHFPARLRHQPNQRLCVSVTAR
ncbi:hypothetical protein FA95DRAFT_1229185 [Auriscalpium vulgare]|uniref:Uncharacterized protein n=1 Tax=Auriscalpium vulgare TaxID=40419 RepID=A0ACB8R2W8_9AGAM|nr:hypothetical protein FA95DRAFT_1229185 [Auriscalpium vulgare]